MREHTNQMSCDGPAVLPAGLLRQKLRKAVQLRRGDVRVLLKMLLTFGEPFFDVTAKLLLERIVSNYVGAPKISFPFLEHRTKIEKDDVIFPDRQVRRIFII